ncbi:MAG: CoA ester lyase [Lysobacterales bacterium]
MTAIRSWLFVPGDSDKKLSKGLLAGADAIIVDLEDAVAPASKAAARDRVSGFLKDNSPKDRPCQLWVRVNPLNSGMVLDDLRSVMAHQPDGLVLPKPDGPEHVRVLSHYLDAFEAVHEVDFQTPILPVATETAVAPFRLGHYATAELGRLAGLTWGAEDLAAAVGATTNRDANGGWAKTYEMARSLTLLAAHAAGVAAVDTLYANFKDETGLRESSVLARAEGFSGRLAIHPAQVIPINESFTPSPEDIDEARRIVAAFDAADNPGAIGFEGRMLDIPHLKQAHQTLALAKQTL